MRVLGTEPGFSAGAVSVYSEKLFWSVHLHSEQGKTCSAAFSKAIQNSKFVMGLSPDWVRGRRLYSVCSHVRDRKFLRQAACKVITLPKPTPATLRACLATHRARLPPTRWQETGEACSLPTPVVRAGGGKGTWRLKAGGNCCPCSVQAVMLVSACQTSPSHPRHRDRWSSVKCHVSVETPVPTPDSIIKTKQNKEAWRCPLAILVLGRKSQVTLLGSLANPNH